MTIELQILGFRILSLSILRDEGDFEVVTNLDGDFEIDEVPFGFGTATPKEDDED